MPSVEPSRTPCWYRHEGALVTAFATGSHAEGAQLGRDAADLSPAADVDVRQGMVRVRLPGAPDRLVTQAEQLGQRAWASALQTAPQAAGELSVVVQAARPAAVAAFWTALLGYQRSGSVLSDPLRRRPAMLLREVGGPAGPRSWWHLDVSRPGGPSAEDAPGLGGQHLGGPFGVRAADAEGNVADVLPSGPCSEAPAVSAWHGGFAAQACWRAPTGAAAADFVVQVAGLADAAGSAVAIDRRGDRVVVDSGKDCWETPPGFPDLAAEIQAAATRAQLRAAPAGLGFVQAFLSAEDAARVRAFWRQVLGYREDRRADVLDIVDPHGLGPVVAFQDVDEPMPRGALDAFHLRCAVPAATAVDKADRARSAGGSVGEHAPGAWAVSDPEGNALELVAVPEV